MIFLPLLLSMVGLLGCEKEPHVIRESKCEQARNSTETKPEDMKPCFEIAQDIMHSAAPNIGKARGLYAAGCNIHHGPSCNSLAQMVRDAKGGPPDPGRAVDLFNIACKAEISNACVDLAVLYYEGKGVREPKYEEAVALLTPPCIADEGDPRACTWLGRAFHEGNGVEKRDRDLAALYFTTACDKDHAAGCLGLGKMFAELKVGRRSENMAKAEEHLERACELDKRLGCFELADLHVKGKAPEADDTKASQYYQKSCNVEPPRGCFEAAQLMKSGRVEARPGEIESLLNSACVHGHSEACAERARDNR